MLDITPKLSLFYARIVFAYFCLSMVSTQHEVRVDKSRLATLVPSWIYSVWEHRSHRERLYDQIWAHIILLLLTPENPWSIDPIKETADCSISFERGIIIIGANILQKPRRERATTEREKRPLIWAIKVTSLRNRVTHFKKHFTLFPFKIFDLEIFSRISS